jgi:transcriptional regulator with XRE-family HTH domain
MAVASARSARGLTQRELAARLGGVIRAAVYGWETGRKEPPPETVFAIEGVLAAPPGALSRALGYVPVSFDRVAGVPSVRDAVIGDLLLGAVEKRALVALYEAFTAGRTPGHGRAPS